MDRHDSTQHSAAYFQRLSLDGGRRPATHGQGLRRTCTGYLFGGATSQSYPAGGGGGGGDSGDATVKTTAMLNDLWQFSCLTDGVGRTNVSWTNMPMAAGTMVNSGVLAGSGGTMCEGLCKYANAVPGGGRWPSSRQQHAGWVTAGGARWSDSDSHHFFVFGGLGYATVWGSRVAHLVRLADIWVMRPQKERKIQLTGVASWQRLQLESAPRPGQSGVLEGRAGAQVWTTGLQLCQWSTGSALFTQYCNDQRRGIPSVWIMGGSAGRRGGPAAQHNASAEGGAAAAGHPDAHGVADGVFADLWRLDFEEEQVRLEGSSGGTFTAAAAAATAAASSADPSMTDEELQALFKSFSDGETPVPTVVTAVAHKVSGHIPGGGRAGASLWVQDLAQQDWFYTHDRRPAGAAAAGGPRGTAPSADAENVRESEVPVGANVPVKFFGGPRAWDGGSGGGDGESVDAAAGVATGPFDASEEQEIALWNARHWDREPGQPYRHSWPALTEPAFAGGKLEPNSAEGGAVAAEERFLAGLFGHESSMLAFGGAARDPCNPAGDGGAGNDDPVSARQKAVLDSMLAAAHYTGPGWGAFACRPRDDFVGRTSSTVFDHSAAPGGYFKAAAAALKHSRTP
eukprot:SAG22_NODE_521_length_9507_cov_62.835991_2_plen_626_part_00